MNVLSVSNSNACITYCIPEYSSNGFGHIKAVQLGTINNTSGINATVYTSYVTAPTPTQTTNLVQGVQQTMTVNVAGNGEWNNLGVWIDYNADGDFYDAGEQLRNLELQPDGNISFSFTVPANAVQGYTRLRLRLRGNPFLPGMDPCENYYIDYGEAEDYLVNILPPCSGQTSPVITAGGPTTFCQGSSVTLTARGAATYVWSTGATTASIVVTTAGTYAVTGTTAAGCNGTSVATTVSVTPQPAQPTLACYEKATFNPATCAWIVAGTQPFKPENSNCWDNYQFTTSTCAWVNIGTQPARPTTGCYLQATFNTTTCQWDVPTLVTYYSDADSDGFGNSTESMQSCTQPSGYVLDNSDCDDTKGTVNPNTVWFKDGDNDGYYTGSGITGCASPGAGYKFSGLVGGGDCNDANENVSPGKTEICGNNVDDNCDGQIDEGCNNKALLSISDAVVNESAGKVTLTISLSKQTNQPITVNYTTIDGTARSKANRNNPADYIVKSGLFTIPEGGQSTTVTITIISDNVQEAMEQFYVELSKPVNVAIGKGRGTVTIMDVFEPTTTAKSTNAVNEDELFSAFTIQVLPNPSSNYFTIDTKSSNKQLLNVKAVDALGRLIETKNNIPANGNFRIGDNYRPGIYFVEIIQGSESRRIQIVKNAN